MNQIQYGGSQRIGNHINHSGDLLTAVRYQRNDRLTDDDRTHANCLQAMKLAKPASWQLERARGLYVAKYSQSKSTTSQTLVCSLVSEHNNPGVLYFSLNFLLLLTCRLKRFIGAIDHPMRV